MQNHIPLHPLRSVNRPQLHPVIPSKQAIQHRPQLARVPAAGGENGEQTLPPIGDPLDFLFMPIHHRQRALRLHPVPHFADAGIEGNGVDR